MPRIDEQMAKRDLDAARESLSAILETLVHRCQKGVFDEDPRLYNNLGFIGRETIFIDIGRFVRDPSRKDPAVYLADLKRITDKSLRGWLQSKHPQLITVLDQELSKLEACP